MIHEWKATAAQYAVTYKGKEYVFYVREDGTGVCAALHDAWNVIAPAGRGRMLALIEALVFLRQRDRAASIEEEFSCDIRLPQETSRRLWQAWTLAVDIDASPQVRDELNQLGEWLDQALLPILEANFPN